MDVAIAHTVLDFHDFLFDDVAGWIQQFHIDNLAEVAKLSVISTHHVGLEPHGFAFEVARVVEMQIDFLLWIEFVEAHGTLHVGENAVVG